MQSSQDDATDLEASAVLPGESSGVWLVTTRSSEHFFDLDRSMYLRRTVEGRDFPHDRRWCRLTRVETPVQVGGRFFVWFDDPDTPDTVEHWRMSSTVRSVERHDGADPAD